MYALETRAPAEVFVPRRVRSDLTEQRLREFRPEIRGPVKALARRHRNLADLAASFPALLFALAQPRKGFDPEPAIRAVVAGQPLDEVARLAGVPRWLRHVAPPMFARALPALPDSALLRRTIVNHLPRKAKHASVWFETVAAAARDGTEELALWCARHLAHGPDRDIKLKLPALCLYAWYSVHPETQAHARIARTFHPDVTVQGAITQAGIWFVELELDLFLGAEPLEEIWFETDIVDGYEFVPIRSAAEVREEARAMRNCVKTYGYGLAAENLRLFSVRKDGQRVATASLDNFEDSPLPGLTQLKAAENLPVSDEVALAVQRWLFSRPLLKSRVGRAHVDAILQRKAWLQTWRPYWVAKRHFPSWLPIRPSYDALIDLERVPRRRRARRRRPAPRIIQAV